MLTFARMSKFKK